MTSMARFQFRDCTKLTSSWDYSWVELRSFAARVAVRPVMCLISNQIAGSGCRRRLKVENRYSALSLGSFVHYYWHIALAWVGARPLRLRNVRDPGRVRQPERPEFGLLAMRDTRQD
jgi:hypothetical protein